MRGYDAPIHSASSACVMPSGSRNSSRSIVPGCVGGRLVGMRNDATASRATPRARLLGGGRTTPRPGLVPTAFDGFTSVVVGDLDVRGSVRRPDVADPVLVVDPDRVLSLSVMRQLFPVV